MCVIIIVLIVAPVTRNDNINLFSALILPTVVSFEVDFEKAPNNSTSQLHILRDKVCLSTNQDYDFKLFGEWPIVSLSRLLMAPGVVTLIMTSQAKEEEALLLKTERGNDICSKLNERHKCLAPTAHGLFQYDNSLAGVQKCDGNSNIMSSSRLSKSCESMHQLHFEPLRSKCKTFPLGSRQSSLSCLPSYLESKSPLSSDENISKEECGGQFSDSCSSTSTGYCSNSEHDVTQNQMELAVRKAHTVANEIKDGDEENQNRGEPPAPPIPERQLRHNSVKAESAQQVKEKFSYVAKYSERNSNVKDFTFQRSRSFQIVEQEPLSGRRQRFKSESSLITKTAITELVRPIPHDCSPVNSSNPRGSDSYFQENRGTNMEPRKGVCSPKQDKENACSQAIGDSGLESFGCKPTAIQSRALTHPFCMPASNNSDVIVDEKSQDKVLVKDDMHASDSSTCHYVNLPEGSRPSCYLYMNLPDPKKAPKEASSYVNHVFMSRSMKGIYENVQQFYNEKFETAASSEEETSAPPLPPPALQPRPPPPRLPRRASKAQQGAQKSSDKLPTHIRVPLGPPPPRPPKKQIRVSLTKVLVITLNIASIECCL